MISTHGLYGMEHLSSLFSGLEPLQLLDDLSHTSKYVKQCAAEVYKVNIDHKIEAKKCSNSHSACIGICWNLQAKIEVSQTQSSDLKTPLSTFN